MTHLVAVYGSLRKGMGNSRLLKWSKYLSTEVVQGFDMFSLGAFPYIDFGDGEVVVEVYEVGDDTFSRLDVLEGYPGFYNRTRVHTSQGEAWIYYIENDERRYSEKKVEGGDWVSYRQAA